MALIRISGPEGEPIALGEAKLHLRVDFDQEDNLISADIIAAREWIERRCGRSFGNAVWEIRQPEFETETDLPYPPTLSITSIKYLDADGDEQTVDPSVYDLIEGGEGPATVFQIGEWPDDVADRPDAVRIRFASGYAPSDDSPPDYGANVPSQIKQAMLMLIAHLYENRADVTLTPVRQEVQSVPMGVAELIAPFVVMRL